MSSPGIDGTSRLELLGDLELCDYLDVLMVPAQQRAVGRAVVEYLVGNGGDEMEVCLQNLSQHSSTPAVFQDSLLHRGLTVEVEQIETCPTVLLPPEWDAYLAMLRGKDRHELRRKLRRAEAAARLEYRVTSNAAQLDEDIDTFMALHRMSQQDAKQGFMTPEKEAFFRAMARQLWPQGWLELAFLYADGSRLPPCAVLRMGQRTRPIIQGTILPMPRSAPGLCSSLSASVRPLRGASRLLTSCVAMNPTNIVLGRRISRSTNCLPALPARCRGRVYEWRTSHQPSAAPGRHVQRA